ncbi:MAG: NAD(P)H-binding protein, partial [Actinomycetota bacterium]|nr:NAD(P)H-binding protein [Actinomycetota bacterium]
MSNGSSAAKTSSRETIVVAGARGFVGRALLEALVDDYRVVGLSRSEASPDDAPPEVEWRAADLFRLHELERALEGADRAIYLVHSMQPSARLVQGSFSDLDLLLADNFARAAAKAGVRQIVYVGGLLPRDSAASPHLRSRAEVADVLGSRGVPVTALRAGIIVGPGGPSLWILLNLVRRLPFMVLPSWTESRSHPIALVDVVRAVRCSLAAPDRFAGVFDIGGATVLTYREMMETVARVLHRRLYMLQVSLFSPRLSTLWVQVFGSAPATLVAPLVRSLQHDLVAEPNPLQAEIEAGALTFEEALAGSVDEARLPREPTSSIRLDPRA